MLINSSTAQVTPEYAREMALAMMGLEQLVRQYAMGHPPEVLFRAGGTMVNSKKTLVVCLIA
jgi:hypothetical protein